MIAPQLTEKERQAVAQLRQAAAHLLTPRYDTDFNLLRWAQAYNYHMSEATSWLLRHLKFRRFYDLDVIIDTVQDDPVLSKYFPLGLVGPAGKNNSLLVVECAGRIDLEGILKVVQLNSFLEQRFKFQERMLDCINEVEMTTGRQSSVFYILDLDGLKMDSTLLGIVTGPYRVLWAIVYTNYPEWISNMYIVNAPSYMSMLWRAISPFIPERTRAKVSIYSAKVDWKAAVREMTTAECVPVHWGGTLLDSNGDTMCRDRLNIPTERIPKQFYWKPDALSPAVADLDIVVIAPGSSALQTYVVPKKKPTYFLLNQYADRAYSIAIYYSSKETAMTDSAQMDEWFPEFERPAMPTVDCIRVKVPGPGVIKIKFSNQQAWFRSLSIHYRVLFVDKDNRPVGCEHRGAA
uniref:CRAL-TRIO domain-containing protein n=1 Tax=Plectus sambesii TaxID=2011161 RepID=A0A914XFD4_9BILA